MLSLSEAAIQAALGSLLWPFVRCLAMISTAPVFGHRAIPARVKVILSFLIALLIAPSLPVVPVDAFSLNGLLVLFQQILVGACMGFGLRAIFAAFEVAGDLIGLQMGLGFASFIDPARGTPSPLLATCFVMLAMLVFMATDGHLNLLFMLRESFTLIPVSDQALSSLDWMQLAGLGTVVFALGLQIALPVLAAVLAINIAMGFMSRSAPQFSIFNLGFAITLMAGMIFLWLGLSVLAVPFERVTGIAVPYFRSAVAP